MSDSEDPERLAEGGGGDLLRDALRGARAELPGADVVDAMWARFPLPGPGGVGGSGPKPGPGPSAPPVPPLPALPMAGGGLLKVIAAIASASVIAVGSYFGIRGSGDGASTVRSTAVMASVAPSSSSPSSVELTPPSGSPSSEPAPSVSASSLPSGRAAGPQTSSPLVSETELLTQAHAALGSNPARALQLVAEHRSQYPRGQLGMERDIIEIQALSALGRTDEAKRRADDFRRRHPDSPFGPRLDQMFPPH